MSSDNERGMFHEALVSPPSRRLIEERHVAELRLQEMTQTCLEWFPVSSEIHAAIRLDHTTVVDQREQEEASLLLSLSPRHLQTKDAKTA